MRQLITLIRHEIRLLFISPPVYFAAVTFMLLMGFIYWAILRSLSIEPQDASATVQFFSLFWLPVFSSTFADDAKPSCRTQYLEACFRLLSPESSLY